MKTFYMIELQPDPAALFRFLKVQGMYRYGVEEDPGYAVHAWLKAAFGPAAPQPFRILRKRGRPDRILGYGAEPETELAQRLREFADPTVHRVCPPELIHSRQMPAEWQTGRRLGFEVLCCPVVRSNGVERDAFLARAEREGKAEGLRRAAVYEDWLRGHMSKTAELELVRLEGFQLRRHIRGSHGRKRTWQKMIRPQALFSGILSVHDAEGFHELVLRGIGRHRAFGYGMILLRPVS